MEERKISIEARRAYYEVQMYIGVCVCMRARVCVCACALSLSVVSDSFATPWTIARWAPLFMEFSRQEYWNG